MSQTLAEPNPLPGDKATGWTSSLTRHALSRLLKPVDIASIAYFRIAFGLIMLVEIWRFFDNRWISRYYIDPSFHFTYPGFDWVRPWPGNWMYVHFAALGVFAACIALGFWYRVAAVCFFLGFTYVFLLEQARYLNHFYLMGLVSFVLIFVPAHRACSLDAWFRPGLASTTTPSWALWSLRALIGIPYFFGGLAKLNPDWLQGEPMRSWLANRMDWPVLGPIAHLETTVAFFTYGGLLLDIFAVPMLLWRRTLPLALIATFAFHLMNSWLFRIGIFPWFMMAATLLYLPPHWPRRIPLLGRRMPPGPTRVDLQTAVKPSRRELVLLGFLGLFFLGQLIVPFRHHLYPGEAIWTEEGSMFSWHMMLRNKPGQLQFFATSPSLGRTWEVDAGRYVKRWQFVEMDRRPDLILQLSHHIAADLRGHGLADVQIRVRANAALNGRRSQPLIDPQVDLAAQPRQLWPPASWIMPLQEPLRPRRTRQVAGNE